MMKPHVGGTGSCERSAATRRKCRSCTRSMVRVASTSGNVHGCPVTSTQPRCGFGNAAVGQLQLDVYGEVLNALYVCRQAGLPPDDDAWSLEQGLVDHLGKVWREPDDGIWEVRSGRKAVHLVQDHGVGRGGSRRAFCTRIRQAGAHRRLATACEAHSSTTCSSTASIEISTASRRAMAATRSMPVCY